MFTCLDQGCLFNPQPMELYYPACRGPHRFKNLAVVKQWQQLPSPTAKFLDPKGDPSVEWHSGSACRHGPGAGCRWCRTQSWTLGQVEVAWSPREATWVASNQKRWHRWWEAPLRQCRGPRAEEVGMKCQGSSTSSVKLKAPAWAVLSQGSQHEAAEGNVGP